MHSIASSSTGEADAPRAAPEALAADVERVTVHVGAVPVLRDLSLQVRVGEVVGITGRNGTGKTTLLRTLATVVAPSSGRVAVLGHCGAGPVSLSLRRRIAMVGHTPALHPHRTVREELTLLAAVRDASRDVDRALGFVGLAAAADRRVVECSQGMRRRADLARAWLGAPDLLLLDEPEAGLDVDAGPVIDALVADVRERAGAVVVVGHDLDRLHRSSSRLLHLAGGRLGSEAAA